MKLWHILFESTISQNIQVIPVEYSDEAFYDSDGYSVWEQAFAIASNSGIHIASNKELAFVALDDTTVVGAVWSAIYHDDDQDADVYDFDMAISKDYRNQVGIFLKLMDAAFSGFRDLLDYNPRSYIRVWVINPKLAQALERRYNFEVESQHGDGSCHMTYYGS